VASSSSKAFESLRDLVSEARFAKPTPITRRQHELDQLIQILCRRTKNSVFLVGEPGVGKDALVRGLAHRMSEGDVPPDLADRPILLADPFYALAASRQRLFHLSQSGEAILYVPGLLDVRENMPELVSYLKRGKLQIIATAALLAIRLALDRQDEVVRHFEFVFVAAPTEQEAIEIVTSGKDELERFHGVVISPEALEIAISASARFLPHRPPAERAMDLLDDAGAKVKIKGEALPPELAEIRKRLRAIARELDAAVGNHEFELAKKLSQEEQEQRDRFDSLRPKSLTTRETRTFTADDILEVIAARTSLTVYGVRLAIERVPLPDERTLLLNQLSGRVPPGRRDWLEGLLAYLTDCSTGDADHLLEAIKTVKAKLGHAS
jgi:ATP-dependent Clp protease ATP-binding subunit ClpC